MASGTAPKPGGNSTMYLQPESNSNTAAQPESNSKTAVQPESNSKTAVQPENNSKTAAQPENNSKTAPQPEGNNKTSTASDSAMEIEKDKAKQKETKKSGHTDAGSGNADTGIYDEVSDLPGIFTF